MTRLGATVLLLALALLALAGVPLAGRWALAPAGLILALALLRPGDEAARGRARAATALGILGGSVGMASALVTLADKGHAGAHAARAGLGWAAFLLAGVALVGGALAPTRPRAAVALLLAGSTAGSAAMAAFALDTWYFAALPLCWLGAALAPLGRGLPHAAGR